MAATDFSDASDLIPAGTLAILLMRVRFGDGPDGVLKKTKAGDAEGLDVEFTVLEGPYAKRKLWAFLLRKGTTDGQNQMVGTVKTFLKRVIDSGKHLDPADMSPEAHAARTMEDRDFDGFKFLAEIGIEAGTGGYPDKNTVVRAITKDRPEWGGRPPLDQSTPSMFPGGKPAANAPAAGQAATTPAPLKKPGWAT